MLRMSDAQTYRPYLGDFLYEKIAEQLLGEAEKIANKKTELEKSLPARRQKKEP
jgi:hypothetical protein